MTGPGHTTHRIEDVLALSPLQEGLYSLAQLAEGTVDIYTMQFTVDIDGPLDTAALQRSLKAMLVRHPNLRASFWDRNTPRPVQIVPSQVVLPWSECNATPEEFDDIRMTERRKPFDLSRGPALRFRLVRLTSGVQRLVATMHHILLDGWSVAVLFTELFATYNDRGSSTLLPPARPYRDYIGWLAARDTAAATRAWAQYLKDLPGPTLLADTAAVPGDEPRQTHTIVPASDTRRLTGWAQEHGLTLNTVLTCAWALVLGRLTDRRDVVFGTTVSGRPSDLAGVETMVGLFINAVPVRVRWDESETILQLCKRLQLEFAQLRDVGYTSLSTVQRAAGHTALFDTFLVYENAPLDSMLKPVDMRDGVRFRPLEVRSLTHYPLSVVCCPIADVLVLTAEATPRLFDAVTTADIMARLTEVLRRLPDAGALPPDEVSIHLPGELEQLAGYARVPALPDTPRASIPELLERQAVTTADAIAVSTDRETLTYAELHTAVAQLAAELIARGAVAEDRVALLLPRSAREMVVALLATLHAGAAYVPVDTALPKQRIAAMLDRCSPVLVVTVAAYADLVADLVPAERVMMMDDPAVRAAVAAHPIAPVATIHPDQCAYVIFTSGSTGEPKGVMGTHGAVAAFFADHRRRVYRPAVARLGRRLTIAHAWSFGFDASWQPLIGLLDGHHIRLFDDDTMRDARKMVRAIADGGVDMIETSPTMYNQLRTAGTDDRRAHGFPPAVLALGGEVVGEPLWQQLRTMTGTAVYNCYGPTETTVDAVVAAVADHREPTIGTPNAAGSAYVLDSRLRPTPNAVSGELYLAGPQLTRGYIGDAGRTAAWFVADPARPGRRMYRTGDLVRRRRDGVLEYHGRNDNQVKIRGYRIEIGEIEKVLLQHPMVHAASVLVNRRSDTPTLLAYVVPVIGQTPDPVVLREHVADLLPGYMVPTRLIVRESLPLTPNGKLDIAALESAAELANGFEPARTETERVLAAVAAAILGLDEVGVTVDMFDLGIDSITMMTLVSRAHAAGMTVSPRMMMRYTTIRTLAGAVDRMAEPISTYRTAIRSTTT